MNDKMDEGDIISYKETIIDDKDTLGSLHDRLSLIGRDLLIETIPNIVNGNINVIKQNNEEATYGYNVTREDEKIDFNKKAREVFNLIRGLNPHPGAYTIFNGKILKVWYSRVLDNHYEEPSKIVKLYEDGIGVSCIDGEIVLKEVQLEGKKRQSAKDFINGHKNELIGSILKWKKN